MLYQIIDSSNQDKLDIKTLTEQQKDNPQIAYQMIIEDPFNLFEISNRLQHDMFFNEIESWHYQLPPSKRDSITSEDLANLYFLMINSHKIENRQEEAMKLERTKI